MTIYTNLHRFDETNWYGSIWWNGTWNVIAFGYTGSQYTPDPNIVVEIFTDPSNPLILPATYTTRAMVVQCNPYPTCDFWTPWEQTVLNSYYGADPPYNINFSTYSQWNTYGP